jgi:amidase
VDPADLPSVVDKDPSRNVLNFFFCSGLNQDKGHDENCSVDLKYGMKRDFNKWLSTLGPSAPVKTLSELRAWNQAHVNQGAIKYGQYTLDISDEMDVEADKARYEHDRKKDIELGGTHGIDEVMKANRLDAIMFPGSGGTTIVDKPGYPGVIVPFGMVPNRPTGQFGGVATAPGPAFPKDFNAKPVPFGVSFAGMACSEGRLIGIGYAFEQATKRRVAPPDLP